MDQERLELDEQQKQEGQEAENPYSKWGYRLTKVNNIITMREVYYNDDNNIVDISRDPAVPHGKTMQEYAEDLDRYVDAAAAPVIDLDALFVQEQLKFAKSADDGKLEEITEEQLKNLTETLEKL